MTRVLIVDDQDLVRSGMRLLLELAGVEVVGEASDGAAAVQAADQLQPDVVLMDLRMPGVDGIEATRRIADAMPSCPVVALTTFDADDLVAEALRAGAVGFLLKDVTAEGLVAAVERAAAGEPVVAPAVLARLMRHFSERPPLPVSSAPGLADLSDRERQILTLIGEGRSNAEIAAELVISMATVKTHVRHLFAKLDARDRAQAIVIARDAGLRR